MTLVTVFRRVPKPITGMIGALRDPAYEAFEAGLDWLETTGALVERFDPSAASEELMKRPAAREALATDGAKALPLILVDNVIVSRGIYPTRTQLARTIGRGRRRVRRAIVRELAAIGAVAAVGTEDDLQAEAARARELGLDRESVKLASEVGGRFRIATHVA